ncbi:hypothetical protein [Shewanella algae]|uniref:hypothetical protein n=1 Tax=Shewanella algae TaxID=38313 RepID=UPI001AAC470E|nr:hypothetical protein [Shewanella algae]MBO2701514.1 hypothetical protein [Shewanella algae]
MENKKWPADLMVEIALGIKNDKRLKHDAKAKNLFDAPDIKMHSVLRITEACNMPKVKMRGLGVLPETCKMPGMKM